MERARRAVQRAAVGLLAGQAVQRVGARLHRVAVRTLELDRNENVPHAHGVVPHRIHADQVIAEARQHGGGQLAGLEPAHAGGELVVEAFAAPRPPAEVAALPAARRVGRLALGDVGELRDARPRRRGVLRRGIARQGHERQPGDRRAGELLLVGRIVRRDLGVAHGDVGVGDLLRAKRQQRHRHRVVGVAIDAPQLGVGDVHVRGDVLDQLDEGDLLAVLRLEGGQELRVGPRLQVALVLRRIELAVGLEFRQLHDLRRR